MHTPRAVLLQTLGHFVLGHSAPQDFAGLPAAAGGGQLLRGRGAGARAGRRHVPARREGEQEPVGRGHAGRVLGVLRDGGAPVHQPRHPSPGPAVPLRQERRGRHHLQGLRERRRGVPGRRDRRDRGPADVPALVGPAGLRRSRPVQPALPVLRHAVGHLLLRRVASTRAASAASRSRSACRSTTPAGSAAGTRPSARKSACPDPSCCQRPPARLAARWEGMAWPSARAHSHILLALPSGSFPGVDEADVYAFLDRHERDLAGISAWPVRRSSAGAFRAARPRPRRRQGP